MKTVFLKEYIDPRARKRLEEHCKIVDHFEHPEELDGILVRRIPVSEDIIKRAVKLKVIAVHGVGTDGIAMEVARKQKIEIVTTPGMSAQSVAELAISFMLILMHKICYVNRGLLRGEFSKHQMSNLVGRELFHKKIGLLGFGNIGKRVGEILHQGFACDIYCYSPSLKAEDCESRGYHKVETLEELVTKVDILNISIPLKEDTKNLVNYDLLLKANKNLLLINTSRGGVVNEQDLYNALKKGVIAGAASDVFVEEPPDKEHPLLSLDNFIGTFHIGGNTVEALERVGMASVEKMLEILLWREQNHGTNENA